MSDARQQSLIDFSAHSKNALLDKVAFPRGSGANQASLKSTLRAIHRFAPSYGWCFVGITRLAAQAGVSESTVRRCVGILVKMGLVAEQRRAKSSLGAGFKFDYRWQVLWGQVQGYVDDCRERERQGWLAGLNDGDWVSSCTHDTKPEPEPKPERKPEPRSESEPKSVQRVQPDSVKEQVGQIIQDTSVVDKARRNGASDELICEVVAVYLANKSRPENRWGPEALHYRLRELAAGQSATSGWFKGNQVSTPQQVQAAESARSREREASSDYRDRIACIREGRRRGLANWQINQVLERRGWELIPEFGDGMEVASGSVQRTTDCGRVVQGDVLVGAFCMAATNATVH